MVSLVVSASIMSRRGRRCHRPGYLGSVSVSPLAYPSHWEADVLLTDGSAASIRPLRLADRELLVNFLSAASDRSLYYRFFSVRPQLGEAEITRLLDVDHDERVALVATRRGAILGVGRYARTSPGGSEAEVAFMVRDDLQGKGLGSVLLEHLAQCARERGVRRFAAEVLPENTGMVRVFADAGFAQERETADGVVEVSMRIDATQRSREVVNAREHVAESRSIRRFLSPRSVAVLGPPGGSAARTSVERILGGGFTGEARCVPDTESGWMADLVVVTGDSDAALTEVERAGEAGAVGVVVPSAGFAEQGGSGRARQQALVRLARQYGMRVLGPHCFGFINTDPAVRLNAARSDAVPRAGNVGIFSQSGELGSDILARCVTTGLGISTFVSAGNRADISANDLMQFWDDDPRTHVVALHLESVGNPVKFARIARRVTRRKPVVAVRSGLSAQRVPLGHAIDPLALPAAAVDDIFDSAGVVTVDTVGELLDVALVLGSQPHPAGDRVAVVSDSDALAVLAADAVIGRGLILSAGGWTEASLPIEEQLRLCLDGEKADAVVVALGAVDGERSSGLLDMATAMARDVGVPMLVSLSGVLGVTAPVSAPVFDAPDRAVRALTVAVRAVEHTRRAVPTSSRLDGVDVPAARRAVSRADDDSWTRVLGAAGIPVLPRRRVDTLVAAQAALDDLGRHGGSRSTDFPGEAGRAERAEVVLKATNPSLRGRPTMAAVRRHIGTAEQMAHAWESLAESLANGPDPALVVQRMAEPGVPVRILVSTDAAFGPVMSVGIAGPMRELAGDVTYVLPPLTPDDARRALHRLRSLPLLTGYRGVPGVSLDPLIDVMLRVAEVAAEIPEIHTLDLDPVLVGRSGAVVLGVSGLAGEPQRRLDGVIRQL